MHENRVQNKPTAAYILSLLGGIFGLIGSVAFIALGAWVYSSISSSDYYYGGSLNLGLFGWGWATFIGLGVWVFIASILIIIFAYKLNANPLEHSKWGAFILVFSIIGLSGGLLALIGGILALIYKPILVGEQPQYGQPPPQQAYMQPPTQPMTRVCPQCGRIVQVNERFCPNCGKQLD